MHSYWWFKPHIVTGVWAVPILLIATLVSDEWYREIGRTPKFIDFETFTVGLFGLLFFIGGAWEQSAARRRLRAPGFIPRGRRNS